MFRPKSLEEEKGIVVLEETEREKKYIYLFIDMILNRMLQNTPLEARTLYGKLELRNLRDYRWSSHYSLWQLPLRGSSAFFFKQDVSLHELHRDSISINHLGSIIFIKIMDIGGNDASKSPNETPLIVLIIFNDFHDNPCSNCRIDLVLYVWGYDVSFLIKT